MTTLGTVLKSSKDKTLTINDRMGKIVLHSVSSRESTLRVRLMPDKSLETLERPAGGTWVKTVIVAHPKFLSVLQAALARAESTSYWYINKDIVAQVSKRFARSK